MHNSTLAVSATRLCLALSAAVVALAASGCGGDKLHGTWTEPNGTIAIPDSVGGGTLSDNATMVFDSTVAPQTFDLKMLLGTQGLTDTLEAHGTYTETDKDLTLTFTGFVVDPMSGDTTSVASDGSQCLTLMGLGGAGVCFSTPQTHPYTVTDTGLTVAIDNSIVGASPTVTSLSLTRSK